jgi:glycine/D-amino acid oxidase-like deaminating enzyme
MQVQMPPVSGVVSSPRRPNKVDVVIVGGGIVGAATAFYLRKRGSSVMLCEKGVIAGEQSGRNLGWCRTLGRDLRELPLMLEAMEIWDQAEALLGEQTGFRRNGVVYLCENEKELANRTGWLKSAEPMGAKARVLDSAQLADLLPMASRSWHGAVYAETDGCAEPQLGAPAFAKAAQRAGAVISLGDAVRGIETTAGRVSAVVTEKGVIKCGAVVVAGGAWSSQFLGNLGIRFPQLSVVTSAQCTEPGETPLTSSVSGSGFTTRKRADGGYNVLANHGEIHEITPASFRFLWDFRHLATSDTGVKLRFSREFFKGYRWKSSWTNAQRSPFEEIRAWDPPVDTRNLKAGVQAAAAAFPIFKNARMAHQWAGVIDVTPDALPVISPIAALPGLFLSSGYSGHGFGIGPAAGRLTADMVSGHAQRQELEPFTFERFDGGSIRPGPAVR